MPKIEPFRGWRYDPAKADYAKTAMPPYDVVDEKYQERLYQRDDRNSVRVILGRQFPTDTASDNRYSRAATQLDAWREEGLLIQDKPAIYVCEQSFENAGIKYNRRGFFARVLLSDWSVDGIYPHEKTLSGPKEDRLKLMRALRGNPEPVFGLLTDPSGDISRSLYQMCKYAPLSNFTGDDGAQNVFWVMDNFEQASAFCAGCSSEQIFIADGHHRYETAINYRNEVREAMKAAGQTPPPLGELECDYILMFIVPDSDPGLVIWPTHRLVHGVDAAKVRDLPKILEKNFLVEKIGSKDDLLWKMGESKTPAYGLLLDKDMYYVALRDTATMDARAKNQCAAWRELDVSVLHLLILEDILGIDEGRLLRKENIFYSKDVGESLRIAAGHEDGVQCGFLMRATTMEQVRNVSRAGEVMPQKSTYFFPKVLSGLVMILFS